MDILSHALWSAIIFWEVNPWLAVLAGVLPDLLAFAPLSIHQILRAEPLAAHHFGNLKARYDKYPDRLTGWADNVYNATHSLLVALAATGLAWMVFGVQLWLLAWPLHVLIDIPLHSKDFFGTKVFWPVSTWAYDGVYWAHPYILAGNAVALVVAALVVAF